MFYICIYIIYIYNSSIILYFPYFYENISNNSYGLNKLIKLIKYKFIYFLVELKN